MKMMQMVLFGLLNASQASDHASARKIVCMENIVEGVGADHASVMFVLCVSANNNIASGYGSCCLRYTACSMCSRVSYS